MVSLHFPLHSLLLFHLFHFRFASLFFFLHSLKYTTAGASGGSRFVLVSEVALGKVKDETKINTALTAPPAGMSRHVSFLVFRALRCRVMSCRPCLICVTDFFIRAHKCFFWYFFTFYSHLFFALSFLFFCCQAMTVSTEWGAGKMPQLPNLPTTSMWFTTQTSTQCSTCWRSRQLQTYVCWQEGRRRWEERKRERRMRGKVKRGEEKWEKEVEH